MRNRLDVRKLYGWYYWFWKLGDTGAVAYCLVMTHDPNAEDNINSVKDLLTHYQTKFERMATSFAIFAIVAATLSTIVLSTGRLYYLTMHHVVTLR